MVFTAFVSLVAGLLTVLAPCVAGDPRRERAA
jgi:hypothetical protein